MVNGFLQISQKYRPAACVCELELEEAGEKVVASSIMSVSEGDLITMNVSIKPSAPIQCEKGCSKDTARITNPSQNKHPRDTVPIHESSKSTL